MVYPNESIPFQSMSRIIDTEHYPLQDIGHSRFTRESKFHVMRVHYIHEAGYLVSTGNLSPISAGPQ